MILRHFPGHGKKLSPQSDFSYFHRENVLVCARTAEVSYSEHSAPLSIKTCLKGTEIYELNGVPLKVEAGSCLVMNNRQRYSSYILSDQEVESFCLFFEDHLANEVLAALSRQHDKLLDDLERNSPAPFFQNLRSSDSVISGRMMLLRQAIGNGQDSQLWLDEQANFLLEILLFEHRQVLRKVEEIPLIRPAARIEIYRRLSLARDYLHSCYDEPVNLKKLARAACLSPHHFLRLFKAVFHQTPHQYLTEIRLQQARQLVTENKISITEICFKVGFENLSSFSRLFKRYFGFSPQELRGARQKEKSNFRTI